MFLSMEHSVSLNWKVVIRNGKKIRKKFRNPGQRPKMSLTTRNKISRKLRTSQKKKRVAKSFATKRARKISMKRRKTFNIK